MIQLPHSNYCSDLTWYPKEWESKSKKIQKDWYDNDGKLKYWYIRYRFYTPENKKGTEFLVKNKINHFKTIEERQEVAKSILDELKNMLIYDGYNPVTGKSIPPDSNNYEIKSTERVCKALRKALDKLTLEPRTRSDINNILVPFEKAAEGLRLDHLQIKEVRKQHIKMILERVGEQRKGTWTATTFNNHRKYLSILFSELVEYEALDLNPITGIKKKRTIKKITQILTLEERERVDKHLKNNYYRFWLLMQIYFHSGGRETELFKVKGKHVNLSTQLVKVTIIKAESRREVLKTIKDVALPFWKEAMKCCGPDDYVFSKGLKPGPKPIDPRQISRRWRDHVKGSTKTITVIRKGVKMKITKVNPGIGITADFRSLKHLASDETSKLLSIAHAQKQNSHKSVKTTKIYAVNEKERQDQEIKRLNNKFA
jgi:site-specific recombinase XerC